MTNLEAELARFETELARFEQPDPRNFRLSRNGASIADNQSRLSLQHLPPHGQGGPLQIRVDGSSTMQGVPPPPNIRLPPLHQGQPPPPPRPGPPPPRILTPHPRIMQNPPLSRQSVIMSPATRQHVQDVSQVPPGPSFQYGGEFFGYPQDPSSSYLAGPTFIPTQPSPGMAPVEESNPVTKKTKDTEGRKRKPAARKAAGEKWFDPTLAEWDESDFRIFVGDLGNEVNDDILSKAFAKYPSFQKAKVIRDKRTNKTKGYGFISFVDGNDFAKAIKEMQGKYIGNRPCKLRKSTWKERADPDPRRKYKEKPQKGHSYKRQRGVLHK